MRSLYVLLLVLGLGAGCDRPALPEAAAPSPTLVADSGRAAAIARLHLWLDARYEGGLAFSPLTKTELGRKEDYDKIDVLERRADDWIAAQNAR